MATRPRREDVRAAILEQAARSFEQDGYARSSLARIAAQAGYTKGAVYSSFTGKPDLFASACASQFENVTVKAMAGMADALDDPGMPRDALVERMADALTDIVLTTSGAWASLLHEFQAAGLREPTVGAAYRDLTTRRRDFLADLIRRHRALENVPAAQITHSASLLLMLMHTLTVERRLAPDSLQPEDVRHALAAAVDFLLP
ncbi:TetR/AcrR family transcriptional regulator [Micrococcus lylae]|uniref:TetR/AcrR family transcriptional regulator n=1 Tax=Micrococcus lylae TaxID=1273 RepID=UPI000C7FBC86|nr:TetR family transcriptional regulator [Micrococcus lylae]WIK81721.1 TetR family transcriptional regulator [Micrococcus lylae]